MSQLIFLLEEPSAQDLLEGLLPRLIPGVTVKYLVFEGKRDLESKMVRRMRGWQLPGARFVVLRDQDAGDCKQVKSKLTDLARRAQHPEALIRVACRELESWIIGDWEAVASAFERPSLGKQQRKARYRDPDGLLKPVDELLKHLPRYRKRDGARRVGRHLLPLRNKSHSFKVFCEGVKRVAGQLAQAEENTS